MTDRLYLAGLGLIVALYALDLAVFCDPILAGRLVRGLWGLP